MNLSLSESVLSSFGNFEMPKLFQEWSFFNQMDSKYYTPSQVDARHGLAMGGQTDSQVGSQVAKSLKFHTCTDDLRSTYVDGLCWVAKQWKPCVDFLSTCRTVGLRLTVGYDFELDQIQRKSTHVNPSWTQVENFVNCFDLWVRLARARQASQFCFLFSYNDFRNISVQNLFGLV